MGAHQEGPAPVGSLCVSVFVSINGFCNISSFQVLSGGPGEFTPVIESVVGFVCFVFLRQGQDLTIRQCRLLSNL